MRNMMAFAHTLLLSAILSICFTATSVQAQDWSSLGIEFEQYLLRDNFEGISRDHRLRLGAARVEETVHGSVAVFPGDNTEGTGLIVDQGQFDDYLLSFRVNRIVGACTIRFRYQDGRYYYLVLSPNLVLYKRYGDGLGAEPLARAFWPLDWNQWYDVDILVIGCSIRVWIDGELCIDCVDDAPVPFLVGGIEFSTSYSLSAPRRFLVDDLEIRQVTATEPHVPCSVLALAPIAGPLGAHLPEHVDQLSSARNLLFEESFEGKDIPDWAIHEACSQSKYLPLEDGWFSQYGHGNTWLRIMADDCLLQVGSEQWSDYVISLRVVPNHGTFTVVFRDSPAGSYRAILNWDEATLSLCKQIGSEETILGMIPIQASTLREGMELAVGGYGPYVGVYLNSMLLIEAEDTSAPLLSGAAGLGTMKTRPPYVAQAAVDDLTIHEIAFRPLLDIRVVGSETVGHGQDEGISIEISHSPESDESPVGDLTVVDALMGNAEVVAKLGGDDDAFLEAGETWRYRTNYVVQRSGPSELEMEICVCGLNRAGDEVRQCTSHLKYNPILAVDVTAPKRAAVGDTLVYRIAVSRSPDGSEDPVSDLELGGSFDAPAQLIGKTGGDQDALLEGDEIWAYEIPHVVGMEDEPLLMLDVEILGRSPDGDLIRSSVMHCVEVTLPTVSFVEAWPLLLEAEFDGSALDASLLRGLPAEEYRFADENCRSALSLTCNCWLNVHRSDSSWIDYAFVTRLAVVHSSLTLSFRMCDAGRYYVEIDPRDGYSGILLLGEEMMGGPRTRLESVPIAIAYNSWHEVVVLGVGATLQVFLDGALLIHYVDEFDPLPFGGVGYETCGRSPEILIDYLKVFRHIEGG